MVVMTNESIVPEELMKLLLNLATKWGDVLDLKTLKVHRLSGSLTNEVYRISWPTKNNENASSTVLVRMYGEGVERFFNRDEEIRTFECLSKKGQGPKLLGQFPNGRVEEFIHSRTLSAEDLRDPEISASIAAKLREFHNLDMPGLKNVILWDSSDDLTAIFRKMEEIENENKALRDQMREHQERVDKILGSPRLLQKRDGGRSDMTGNGEEKRKAIADLTANLLNTIDEAHGEDEENVTPSASPGEVIHPLLMAALPLLMEREPLRPPRKKHHQCQKSY
ncbi:PREDICTED: probable choline kinase 1 [Nicotiana attenuata]|uniref:probable choline kinase 1 n=1 Tax=Nicotiana attenuata TaxID=49451 RepID=UPI00090464BE|nr:PREDICTED: probable choline kinase 1 [Nicotiana attenuata]